MAKFFWQWLRLLSVLGRWLSWLEQRTHNRLRYQCSCCLMCLIFKDFIAFELLGNQGDFQ